MTNYTLVIEKEIYINHETPILEGMPYLKIKLINKDHIYDVYSFYLSPFKYCRFQVSDDQYTNHAYGMSDPIDLLRTYKKNAKPHLTSILSLYVRQAIENFVILTFDQQSYFMDNHDMTQDDFVDVDTILSLYHQDTIKKYVDIIIAYLEKEVMKNTL